jgi:hypothetical protein
VPWEKDAFAQCSVFEGGFTLEAAEAVLDLSAWTDAPLATDAIQALVDKSLLSTWVPAERGGYDIEEPYFGMYISIHEYAEEKLRVSAPPGDMPCEARHGRYFARFGADDALEALFRHGGARRRQTLGSSSTTWSRPADGRPSRRRTGGGRRLTAPAWQVLEFQGPFSLGVALGMEAIAMVGADATLGVPARIALAQALRLGGRVDDARARLTEARSLAETAVDPRLQAARPCRPRRPESRAGPHDRGSRSARPGPGPRRRGGRSPRRGRHRPHPRAAPSRAGPRRRRPRAFRDRAGDRPRDGERARRGHRARQSRPARERAGPAGTGAAASRGGARHRAQAVDRGLEGAVLANLGNLEADQGLRDEALQHTAAALAIQQAVGNRRLAASPSATWAPC